MGKSAGKIMPLPRGAYNENETYNILDMVTLDNKLWIAKKSGITGITPSKTATEWMMAVDGTTDVKALETEVDAKFASIDEQFLAKDTQISGLNGRVTAAEGSITSLGERCNEIDGKFVFDTKPSEGSTKLITSGTVYNTLHYNDNQSSSPGDNGDYEEKQTDVNVNSMLWMTNSAEQRINVGNGLCHRIITGTINLQGGAVYLRQTCEPYDDNTSPTYNTNTATSISLRDGISFGIKSNSSYITNNKDTIYLQFSPDRFSPQDDAKYDLGGSDNKFKDIYAQNGTIKTSDRNEKKDILELDPETNRKFIAGLKPVSYKFINNTSERTHYGLIAQDVEDLLNEIGINPTDFAGFIKSPKLDEDGVVIEGEYIYGLRYDEFIAPLIKMCQNLQNEVNELKIRLGGE